MRTRTNVASIVGLVALFPGSTISSRSLSAQPLDAFPSAGLVLTSQPARLPALGEAPPPPPVQLVCSVSPARAFVGDPVTVTGSPLFLSPERKALWAWETAAGHVTWNGNTATVDTTGLAPGEYTLTGRVSEGNRPRENAVCTARFTLQPAEPPTVACAVQPASVAAGSDAVIAVTASSPQNRRLHFAYTATAGVLTPNGATARLSTAGLGQTVITVTCTAMDDRNQSAHAVVQVAVTAPAVPAIPQAQTLCTLGFDRDPKRPVRVDNEAKACLDDIALTLNGQAEARLVMIGAAAADEPPEAAAERVLNARQYLTDEKGIDPSRIEVRVGSLPGRAVRNLLIPSGAGFSPLGTQGFDETSIPRHGEAYGMPGQHAKRGLHRAVPVSPPAPPPGQVPPPSRPPG